MKKKTPVHRNMQRASIYQVNSVTPGGGFLPRTPEMGRERADSWPACWTGGRSRPIRREPRL